MTDKERSILTNGVRISNQYSHIGWDAESLSAVPIRNSSVSRTVVIQIPMSLFGPKPSSFLNMSSKPSALAIQEALSVFSFLVQHPSLCMPLSEEEEQQNLLQVLEARIGAEQVLRFTSNEGSENMERIRIAMEIVTTAGSDGSDDSVSGTVIAYRIHIMVIDPNIDLGLGLYHLIRYNRAHAKKKSRGGFQTRFDRSVIGPSTYYKRVISTAYWSYTIANQYLRSDDLHSMADQIESTESPLHDTNNPVNPYFVFSLKNACRLARRADVTVNLEGTPCPLQVSHVNYIAPTALAEIQFPKPRLTVTVSQMVFAPEVVNLYQLPSLTVRGVIEEPQDSLGALDAWAIILRKIGGQFSDPMPGNQQSDLHIVARESGEILRNLKNKITDIDERRRAIGRARKFIGNDVRQCFDSRANIATPLLEMVTWHEENVRQATARGEELCYSRPADQVRCLDSALSPFANRRLMDMKIFEDYLEVATTHDTLYTLFIFALDAYRHEKNLHNNAILCGPGGVSKSFIMLLLKDMCVPKTTLFVTHVTEHAACIEEDDNYKIECMEEIPMARLGMEKGMGAQGDPKFKNKLTSQETVSTVFHCDEETGRRSARTIVSESVGVVLGATNDAPGDIPDALRQRFFIKRMNMYKRPSRSIMDYKCQHRSSELKTGKDAALHSYRVTQMMVAWINQLIWCKALPEVDMGAGLVMFKVMIGFLEEKGLVNVTNVGRDVARLKNAARIITIINAIDEVFHTPGKMHWGEPFRFDMLMDVKNALFCTEEIAWFTFSLLKDMFVASEERPLLCGLAKQKGNVPLVKGARKITWDPRYRHNNAADATDKIKYRVVNDGTTDYNYIELQSHNFTQLAKNASKSCLKGVQVSKSNAEMVLKNIESRTFRCHPRTGPNCDDVHNGAMVTKEILVCDHEAAVPKFYLLMEYVLYVADIRAGTAYGSRSEVIVDAIKACGHYHTVPRMILTGLTLCDESPRAPQLFRPFMMNQAEGDELLARVEIAGGETKPFIYTAGVDDTEHDRWCDENLLPLDDPVRTDWRPSNIERIYKENALAAGVGDSYVQDVLLQLRNATEVLSANRKRKINDVVDPAHDSSIVAKRRKERMGFGIGDAHIHVNDVDDYLDDEFDNF